VSGLGLDLGAGLSSS